MSPRSGPTETNPWLVLVLVCFAQFMVVLDATIVNVALPSIQRDLHFSAADLQWVINGYTLVFGGFLLLGGRAGDLVGRKKLFLAGLAVFTVASLIDGLSQSSGMLIASRALQGLGAALVSPAALSIITTTFKEGQARTRALGVWAAIAISGSAVGLLLGGVLTETLSWQWIFFVNIPIGIATFIVSLRYVPESRAEVRPGGFDLAGAASVTGGLVVLVYTLVKAQEFGWGSARTLGLGALAIGLLASFVLIESRSAHPLVRLGVFRIRTLASANGVMLLVISGMFAMFFFASIYVQEILGYSPIQAGLAFLPVTAGIMLAAGAAQGLVPRLGVRNVALIGVALAASGLAWLSTLPTNGSYVSDLLPQLMLISVGMGLTFVPLTLLGTTGVDNNDAGLASGLFNTSQQVGGALGLAVLSTLAANRTSDVLGSLGHAPTPHEHAAALVDGFSVAFAAGAGLMALAGVLLFALIRPRHVAHITADDAALAGAAA
jgi:EmrB/QacA subfamily drug resistance transporter